MDCITISTFRSLEQQAIRQHRERLSNSNNRFVSKETFGHENLVLAKSHKINDEPTIDSTTKEGKINYFA